MDLSLVVAVLSLLVTTLAETRSIWRDRQKDQIRPLGLSLVQAISTLDEIIEVGERLIALLAEIPLAKEDSTRIAALEIISKGSLSQSAVPKQSASHLQKCQKVFCLLLVTDQQTTTFG